MHHVRVEDLPLRGSSRNFVGANQGGVPISVFLFQFIQQGRGIWTVNGQEFEAGAGDVLVIKAGEIHAFRCTEAPLAQVDVHLSPTFIQENL